MIRSCRGGAVSRRIVIAAAVALIPLIAGCEAGNNPPSLQWHPPTAGTDLTIGDITISNAFVLGAPLGSVLQPGQNAGLFLGLTNTGPHGSRDVLTGVVARDAEGRLLARSVLLPGGRVAVNSQHSVLLTGPLPAIVLQNLIRPVTGGSVVTLILSFRNAGNHTLMVPVMPMAQFFATYSPAPMATPTPTATTTAQPSPSRSPSRSGRHHGRHRSPSPSGSP